MNQLNSADDITQTVTITDNVTNSGTYLWTPPIEYASTSDTYDYQLGVAGYEDDPGLMQGSRLFYIVPADSSPSSSSATPTPTPSPSSTTPSPTPTPTPSPSSTTPSPTPTSTPSTSSTTPSPTPTPTQSSTSTNAAPTAAPTRSSTSNALYPEMTPTQSTVPPVVIHKGVSTGAAAGIGVGVAIAVLIIPLIGILWFVRKRKAKKGGHARPRKLELQGESRVVSELESDEKQRAEMGGIPWRVSSPILEVGEAHELGGRGV
ncbi:hypothetical protein NA56DRAFT_651674 [Hyaloscypha hepaticicola]|uniref:Mid2 domain-containing protein n=1 Tax=Hyaloscypha hepaticicola TaxID=2082293 RepID=A0A2J6PHJ5_9HELO|nr:hypothetical protein NA56DRAFT_651674 [Hyaloscypha hepaticicola]